jgi:Uma2 family endonuclease
MVQLKFQQIEVPPGQNILFHDISWEDFETILDELGEHRGTRIAYNQGILEIMAPLPEHEVDKVLIGDMVKIILDELGMDWECFGSTTFKHQEKSQGIEPDDSFYIKNHLQMRGKKRINLKLDPPPDLAIEIDLTSKTQISTYEALAVPELWVYEKNKLKIYILQDKKYIESATSPTFPSFAIAQILPEYIQRSKTEGTSPTLRAFRKWVWEQIG